MNPPYAFAAKDASLNAGGRNENVENALSLLDDGARDDADAIGHDRMRRGTVGGEGRGDDVFRRLNVIELRDGYRRRKEKVQPSCPFDDLLPAVPTWIAPPLAERSK